MRLSPLDIRQQQFTVRMFRGLDPQEVDAFLEDVAEDYESVLKENALLKEQLAGHEERSRSMGDIERTLRETLVTTQRISEEMKETARREAAVVLREAEVRGERLMDEARTEEAKIRTEIKALRRVHRQLVEDLRTTLDRYHRLFTSDLERSPVDEEEVEDRR
jgi:cell division initiation protein